VKPKSLALPAGRWTWAPVVVALPVTVLGVATPVVGLVATMLVAVAGAMVTLPIGAFLSVLVLFAPVRLFVSVPLVGAELSMTGLVVFSLAVVLCARRLLEGRPALSRWEWVIALWWGWILISWLWSSDRRASFHGTYQWSLLFAAVFVTVQSLTAGPPAERTARRVITALLVLAAGWSALGLLESAIGLEGILAFLRSPGAALLFPTRLVREKLVAMDFNWISGDHVQPFGPFVNSIEFGIFTAAGMGVAVAIVVSRNRLAPRWLAFLTFVLALAANVAALKATGWLAAVVALVTVFVALGGSLRRLLTYGLLIGTVLTVFAQAFR